MIYLFCISNLNISIVERHSTQKIKILDFQFVRRGLNKKMLIEIMKLQKLLIGLNVRSDIT
jgi:hypothetical protein